MTEIIHKNNKVKALLVGTVTGWLGVGIIDFITLLFMGFGAYGLSKLFTYTLLYYVIIGLPIALFLCFSIGLPIFLTVENNRRIDRYNAILIGAIVGTCLGAMNGILLYFSEVAMTWVLLDWLSTTLVGAIAGYVSFHFAKRLLVNIEGDPKQQTVLGGSE